MNTDPGEMSLFGNNEKYEKDADGYTWVQSLIDKYFPE